MDVNIFPKTGWFFSFLFISCVYTSKAVIDTSNYRDITVTSTNYCEPDGNLVYKCDLKNMEFLMKEANVKHMTTNWTKITFWNALGLVIEPQCGAEKNEIKIVNSLNIASQLINNPEIDSCTIQLRLENCTANSLDSLFNLINVAESSIGKIKLTVDNFDITKNSSIGEIDLKSVSHKSTVIDSEVDLVTRLELEGTHKLEIENSLMKTIKKFIYNTSYSGSIISDTRIGSISDEGGFQMLTGELELQNVDIEHLYTDSIVINGGKLVLTNVNITEANEKSILIKGSANVIFQDVTIGEEPPFNYEITTKNHNPIWPLASLQFEDKYSLPLIVGFIGAIFSFVLGLISACLCFRYCNIFSSLLKRIQRKEEAQLPLTMISEQSAKPLPPTPLVNHPPKDTKNSDNKLQAAKIPRNQKPTNNFSTSEKSPPPLPTAPWSKGFNKDKPLAVNKDISADELYDEYPHDEIYDECGEPSDEIYDECETTASSVGSNPQMETNATHMNNERKQLPVMKRFPMLPKPEVKHDQIIQPKKLNQTPLTPNPKGNKVSFLHTKGAKPPPPPRVKQPGHPAPTMPPTPALPPAPALPPVPIGMNTRGLPSQSFYANQQCNDGGGSDEDIYETVP